MRNKKWNSSNPPSRLSRHRAVFVVLIFTFIRLLLPYILKWGVNFYLADHVDGYTGHVEGIGLSLYRAAFQVEDLELSKVVGSQPEKFLTVKTADVHFLLKPLLIKRIHLRASLSGVEFSYIKESEKEEAAGQNLKEKAADHEKGPSHEKKEGGQDKTLAVTVDTLKISQSEIHYKDFHSQPKIDVWLSDLDLNATNLTTEIHPEKELESKVSATAIFKNHGTLKLEGGFNLLKKPISFDYNFSAQKMLLIGFNEFFQAYGGFEVKAGTFDLFSELASSENKLKGYVKPVFSQVDVLSPDEKLKSLKDGKHELIAAILEIILHNGKKDQVATKIPIEGTVDKVHLDLWAAVRSSIQNAFSKPVDKKVDHEIDINSPKK